MPAGVFREVTGARGVRRRRRAWLATLASVLLTHGCSDASEARSASSTARWELAPTASIEVGEIDGAPEEVFSRISAVALLGDGGLAVGNASSATVRVFDAGGAFENEFGGEGQGPGEFSYLGSVRVVGGDTILAYDPVAFRLSVFTRSGQLLETIRMEPGDGAPEVYLGRDRLGQHLVALIRPTARDQSTVTADLMEVRRYSPDGSEWTSLGTFPGMRRMRSPVPLSPHFIGAVLGDTAFVTDGLVAMVAALGPLGPSGGTTRVIEATHADEGPTVARRHLREAIEDTAVADRLRDAEATGRWDSVPRFSEVLPDPTGLLWLKQYDPRTDSHWVSRRRTGGIWTVSSTDGKRVAEVAVPDDFRLMSTGPGRVAGVRIDELGVERVVVYVLRRG